MCGQPKEPAHMALKRLVVVLAAALAALMAVVVLRAETTQLHYQLSQLDRRTQALRQEAREKELELMRLRNPALIRAKLAELRLHGAEADVEAVGESRGKP